MIADRIAESFESGTPDFDINWQTFRRLLSIGIPTVAILRPELPKIARVAFNGGLFKFEDEANGQSQYIASLIFPARTENGTITDLAAISPTWRVATYYGVGGVLGRECMYQPRILNTRTRLFSTPIDWLCAERNGLLLIDPIGQSTRLALITARDFGGGLEIEESDIAVVEKVLAEPSGRIFVRRRVLEVA